MVIDMEYARFSSSSVKRIKLFIDQLETTGGSFAVDGDEWWEVIDHMVFGEEIPCYEIVNTNKRDYMHQTQLETLRDELRKFQQFGLMPYEA
jgi:hypothetical protein